MKVITDHKDLEYSITTKKLAKRQVCCSKFLSEFNFVISFIPGKKNRKTNSLTCQLNDCLANDLDEY